MAKKKPKNPYRVRWFRVFGKTIVSVGAIITILLASYIYIVLQTVPTVHENALKSDSSSKMYALDGTLIATNAKYKRQYVNAEDIPQSYIDLLISTEDREFYKNKGFSPKGLVNAGVSSVGEKLGLMNARGGSGLEQQLIKLSVFSTSEADRTPKRKIQELFLSSQLYHNYSKEKTLEFYVNKIYMGENAFGAQTISQVYFDKDLKDLTISQQAIIAGLGQAPSYYNLYDNPEAVDVRRKQVLDATLDNGKITKAQYDEAIATSVDDGLIPRFSKEEALDEVTKQHNAFISSAWAQIEEMGYDLEKTPLEIYTTLDIAAENEVRDILDNHPEMFQDDRHQSAVTVTDPTTGAVIAEVGGRFSNEISGLNRATQKNRSTGSSIKPILEYGPAVEYFNWPTNKVLDGSPYTYPGTNITAYDYGGEIHGDSEMKVALRNSYNPPAIRTLDAVGETRANEFIKGLGINTEQTLAGTAALGLDASTTQMASAMGAFGQEGIYRPTRYIEKIRFSDESEKQIRFDEVQSMRASTAFVMTDMLKGVISDKGTMPNGKIEGVNQAAKTGTVGYPATDYIPLTASMDVWTVGYTKSLSIAVWQGYDTPMEPNSYISQYFTLEHNGEIYRAIMERLSKGRDNSDWVKPDTVDHIGGKGLNANYVPNDTPMIETMKPLDKPEINTLEDYSSVMKEDNKDTKYKVIKPQTPRPPKDWKKGSWEKPLEDEKTKFYDDHKNDKEEAAKVD